MAVDDAAALAGLQHQFGGAVFAGLFVAVEGVGHADVGGHEVAGQHLGPFDGLATALAQGGGGGVGGIPQQGNASAHEAF